MYISDVGNNWIPSGSKKRSGYVRNQATIDKIKSLGIFEICIYISDDTEASESEKNKQIRANTRARLLAEKERLLALKKDIQIKKRIKDKTPVEQTQAKPDLAEKTESQNGLLNQVAEQKKSKQEPIDNIIKNKDQLKITASKVVDNPKGLLDQISEQKAAKQQSSSESSSPKCSGLLDEISEQKAAQEQSPSEPASPKRSGLLDEISEQKAAQEQSASESASPKRSGLLDEISEQKATQEQASSESPSPKRAGLLDEISQQKATTASSPENISQNTHTEGLAQKAKKYIPGAIVAPFEEEFSKAQVLHGKMKSLVKESMDQAKIGKPFDIDGIEDLADGMIDSIISNRNTLSMMSVIKNQDNYLHEHSVNCGVLMGIFARQLKLPLETIHDLITGAILHDIGMSKIDDAILLKPSKLTTEETIEMQKHVIYGRRMLEKNRGIPAIALEVCKQHHERLDGIGYPQKLHSHQVNQYGRMAAIVDTYDALTSARVYRAALSPAAAMKTLLGSRSGLLDGKLVYQFIQSINIYPVGSLVELDDSRVAVVHELNVFKKDQPKVRVFYNGKSECNITPETVDLSHPDIKTKIKKTADIVDFDIRLEDVI